MSRGKKRYPNNTIGIKFLPEHYRWVKAIALEADVPLSVVVREIVIAKIEQDDNPGGG